MQDDSKPRDAQQDTIPTLTDVVIAGDPRRRAQDRAPREPTAVPSVVNSSAAPPQQSGRPRSPVQSDADDADSDEAVHDDLESRQFAASSADHQRSSPTVTSVEEREIIATVEQVVTQRLSELKQALINEVAAGVLARISRTKGGPDS